MILLHGFTQTAASWDPVRARLGDATTVAPHLRGHGAERDRRPIDFAAAVSDAVAAAPGGATLCGYSLGGRIALRAALDVPSHFSRLVLVSSSPGIADAAERAERRASDETLAAALDGVVDGPWGPGPTIEAFASWWGAQPLFATQSAEVRAAAHADRLRNEPRALAAALRGLGTGVMEPLWDRLVALAMPVTLVAGERDAKFVAVARRMAETIPGADLVLVPGAGHAVHLEDPDAVAAVLHAEPGRLGQRDD